LGNFFVFGEKTVGVLVPEAAARGKGLYGNNINSSYARK
jgi:hypothetical protein